MFFVEEALSLAAFAFPGASEAGEAVAVERHRLPGPPQVARHVLMEEQQH